MTTDIEIVRLRGIREGRLAQLDPLTVLVGANGSGKSTLLDAFWLVGHEEPGIAIGKAGVRRKGAPQPARWLIWRAGGGGPAEVVASSGSGDSRSIRMEWSARRSSEIDPSESYEGREHYGAVKWWMPLDGPSSPATLFYTPDRFEAQSGGAARWEAVGEVRHFSAARPAGEQRLESLLTRAVELGSFDQVLELVSSVIPGLRDIRILTEAGKPVVHLVFKEESVPAALASDGIRWLTSLCFQLAVARGGLLLLEEPETSLHPRFIALIARALVAATQAGTQVVLSTHSLELIDALLDAAEPDGVDALAVHRVALSGGILSATRIAGSTFDFSAGTSKRISGDSADGVGSAL